MKWPSCFLSEKVVRTDRKKKKEKAPSKRGSKSR